MARKTFIMKIPEDINLRLIEESEKIGLTKSGFVTMLIATYKKIDIDYSNNINKC